MRFPFDALTLRDRLKDLQIALLRASGGRRNLSSHEPQALTVQEFGHALFDALFAGDARSCYDAGRRAARAQGAGLRLRLRIYDPVLAVLPWEFLYDPRRGDFVCLSRRTPLVRYLELPEPVGSLAVAPPLRVLGMAATPPGLAHLDLAHEREQMERALRALRADGRVELRWLRGETWRELHDALQDGPWHIFHFLGHGGFDAGGGAGEGYLALTEPGGRTYYMGATALGRLLTDHEPLRLAVLNACEGARGSGLDLFSGTAATLVRMGLPAVVAMQYEITDRAAVEFAGALYGGLARGQPIDAAVGAARQAMSLEPPGSLEWGTPVLYLRAPDGRLFDLTAATAPPPPAGWPPSADDAMSKERLATLRSEATAAYWTDHWEQAVALLEEYLSYRPDDRDATVKLEEARRQQVLAEHYDIGTRAAEARDWPQAVEHLTAVVALDPGYRDVAPRLEEARRQRGLAGLYAEARQLHADGQWLAVVRVFGRMRELDVGSPDPEGLLAAAQAALAAAEEEQTRATLHAEGVRLLESGDWAAAAERFGALERRAPGYRGAAALLARAHREVTAQEAAERRQRVTALYEDATRALRTEVDRTPGQRPAGGKDNFAAGLVGQTLGNYHVEVLLGAGGMGWVYRGTHLHIGRTVAIKVLHPHLTTNPSFQPRFVQEAKAWASLAHQNIIGVHDFGAQDGHYYLVMELATGGSLRSLLQRHTTAGRPLPWQAGISLIVQAADGLEHAHSKGVIHCSIKPENLLLQSSAASTPAPSEAKSEPRSYVVKLTDFGLAHLRVSSSDDATGIAIGSLAYMSPEQYMGLDLDGRSDLYSLGIVLYEVATGYLPFETKNLDEALHKHIDIQPPPPRGVRPDLPRDLEAIILRCLAKGREERFPTAGALAEALREQGAVPSELPWS